MRTLARVALAAIAVHVADDAFLQPQPGTAAGDHLVGGLVPLAVLAWAAWGLPGLRPGLRGTLAVALGVLGVAAGLEGAYYAREVGASGDDFTGLLALAAGAVLVVLGALTLWRSRRTDGGWPRRAGRRTLLSGAAILGAAFVVVPIGMAYVETHTARAVVAPDRLGAAHEDVSFRTADGLRLRGWYVPSRNGAAVIAFPGRKGPQAQARMLARHGYGVLLFDRRGEGASDGDPNAWGWGGERDIEAAIAFLRHRPDVDAGRIGGLGLSVGGELMIEAAAEGRGPDAVVSEGAGIRSVREHLDLPSAHKWVLAPFAAVHTAAVATFAGRPPPPDLMDLVGRVAPRPLLLIGAGRGVGGEPELNPEYARAAGEPSALWMIPEAEHMGGIRARPAEYERRVLAFFDDALPR